MDPNATFATTTDGFVYPNKFSEVVLGIIEIKCPYTLRDYSFSEKDSTRKMPAYLDANLKLKTDNDYYHEIQGELYITNAEWCDLVVWTPKDMLIDRIERNDRWRDVHLPILKSFVNANMAAEAKADPTETLQLKDRRGVKRKLDQTAESSKASKLVNSTDSPASPEVKTPLMPSPIPVIQLTKAIEDDLKDFNSDDWVGKGSGTFAVPKKEELHPPKLERSDSKVVMPNHEDLGKYGWHPIVNIQGLLPPPPPPPAMSKIVSKKKPYNIFDHKPYDVPAQVKGQAYNGRIPDWMSEQC
jgi:hypothetical protein